VAFLPSLKKCESCHQNRRSLQQPGSHLEQWVRELCLGSDGFKFLCRRPHRGNSQLDGDPMSAAGCWQPPTTQCLSKRGEDEWFEEESPRFLAGFSVTSSSDSSTYSSWKQAYVCRTKLCTCETPPKPACPSPAWEQCHSCKISKAGWCCNFVEISRNVVWS